MDNKPIEPARSRHLAVICNSRQTELISEIVERPPCCIYRPEGSVAQLGLVWVRLATGEFQMTQMLLGPSDSSHIRKLNACSARTAIEWNVDTPRRTGAGRFDFSCMTALFSRNIREGWMFPVQSRSSCMAHETDVMRSIRYLLKGSPRAIMGTHPYKRIRAPVATTHG